jgi:hypothetical protein
MWNDSQRSGKTKNSEVRNEPQRSGEAEHWATCAAGEGSIAQNQREEERLSVKRGSGETKKQRGEERAST